MDTTEKGTANHDQNSYFEAFARIVEALDVLAKAVTPDGSDDGTPPEEMPVTSATRTSHRSRRLRTPLRG